MYSRVLAGAVIGMECYLTTVETDISTGLPVFHMVGIPGTEVKEAVERVRVALRSAGYTLPASRVTVNFTPADIPKRNVVLDLPVAAGILVCLGIIPQKALDNMVIAGELGLNGEVRPVKGVLPIAVKAAESGMKRCIVPADNLTEGAAVDGIKVTGISDLKEFIRFVLTEEEKRDSLIPPGNVDLAAAISRTKGTASCDFAMVHGQHAVKRALEIAAAGLHNIMMIGSPGSGKSMLARCVRGILPPLTPREALEVSAVYSVAGRLCTGEHFITARPIAEPHCTATGAALFGGGSPVRPGLVSMAHRGILFMDEFPHFGSEKINALRGPLEDGTISIARNSGNFVFPARFMLVAAANPCLCGYHPDKTKCTCTPEQINRYFSAIRGPVADRIDLCVRTDPVTYTDVFGNKNEENSECIRKRVQNAWQIQQDRFRECEGMMNSDMTIEELEKYCQPDSRSEDFISSLFENSSLSVRGYHRILRCARTIADLAGSDSIRLEHIAEAASYRLDIGEGAFSR